MAKCTHGDYTVGCVCALPLEMSAMTAMLDSRHPDLPLSPADKNSYVLGSIGEHNIVIACLPAGSLGTLPAATAALQMLFSFPAIRFGLMVGIGGAVPSEENDIRLGDVVVSQPKGTSGGVIQYDMGKMMQDGHLSRTGSLDKPPVVLRTAVAHFQAESEMRDIDIGKISKGMLIKYPKMETTHGYPGSNKDTLYNSDYIHPNSSDGRPAKTCVECCKDHGEKRSRKNDDPVIHYGLIASGNLVMKDSTMRDRLGRELGVICFEMEAAGLMDNFPCLVIRGISDYSDSHKNDDWQGYAAAVAAAYAKALLAFVSVTLMQDTPSARQTMGLEPNTQATTQKLVDEMFKDLTQAREDIKNLKFRIEIERNDQRDGRTTGCCCCCCHKSQGEPVGQAPKSEGTAAPGRIDSAINASSL